MAYGQRGDTLALIVACVFFTLVVVVDLAVIVMCASLYVAVALGALCTPRA